MGRPHAARHVGNLTFPLAAFLLAPFALITAIAWVGTTPERWSLTTLAASAVALLLATTIAAFPVSARLAVGIIGLVHAAHALTISATTTTYPDLTFGDPPGTMLGSFAFQSPTHAMRVRLPVPHPGAPRHRARIQLAAPYQGPARVTVTISGTVSGTMTPEGMHDQDGGMPNFRRLEFTYESARLNNPPEVVVAFQSDTFDVGLRFATWKSSLGRTFTQRTDFLTEFGVLAGLPHPVTGEFVDAWPVAWIDAT